MRCVLHGAHAARAPPARGCDAAHVRRARVARLARARRGAQRPRVLNWRRGAIVWDQGPRRAPEPRPARHGRPTPTHDVRASTAAAALSARARDRLNAGGIWTWPVSPQPDGVFTGLKAHRQTGEGKGEHLSLEAAQERAPSARGCRIRDASLKAKFKKGAWRRRTSLDANVEPSGFRSLGGSKRNEAKRR